MPPGTALLSSSSRKPNQSRFKREGVLESNVTRVQECVQRQDARRMAQNPRTLGTRMGRGGSPGGHYRK